MLTPENFRQIYDIENRKGFDVASAFFPILETMTEEIRDKVKAIRDLRANASKYTPEKFRELLQATKVELADLKEKKSNAIDDALIEVSDNVGKTGFKIILSQKTGPKGKPVFCIDSTPETFFVVKQLQRNIHRIYGVKQSNRHELVSQLRDTIGSKFPFEIVRTDITSFYETIDRKKLTEKLDDDQLLSAISKKFIKQILASYEAVSGSPTGVPRGVGISAYLAELYLRSFDDDVRQLPGLVLYCRFVDDIVAVFARPPAGGPAGTYAQAVTDLLQKLDLLPNPTKTKAFNLATSGNKKFEYLGYRFQLADGHCAIWPSAAKVAKYRARLRASFRAYHADAAISSRHAFRQLVGRVKFLTGNARLSNSKSRAVTGIYYNNPLVTEFSSFELLDKLLKAEVAATKRKVLKARLKPHSFVSGFKERRFHNFSTHELKTIVEVWKHG